MAKRKRPSERGRSGDPSKRAAEEVAAHTHGEAETTPELADEVAAALRSGHPIDIVMLASSLIASLDPAGHGPDADLPDPAEFVRMFLDSGDRELMVFGWVIAQLLPDARLQAETRLAVADSWLPDWLAPLPAAEVVGAWQTTDPLRDTTDVVLTLRIGSSEPTDASERSDPADLSLISLIDFNADGAVKDAFVVPTPLAAVQEALSGSGRSGMDARDLTPADTRAWLTDGVAVGREVTPPFESDTWPQCRPLMEWALRLCPSDGHGWHRRTWTTREIADLVKEFAATLEGEIVADPLAQDVLVDALQVLGRETYGDPRLLSAVTLEMGLGHLWATAVHHELDRVLALPEALGPFVRWTHAQRGISADDTDEALAVIAHRRAEFSRDVAMVHEIAGDDTAQRP